MLVATVPCNHAKHLNNHGPQSNFLRTVRKFWHGVCLKRSKTLPCLNISVRKALYIRNKQAKASTSSYMLYSVPYNPHLRSGGESFVMGPASKQICTECYKQSAKLTDLPRYCSSCTQALASQVTYVSPQPNPVGQHNPSSMPCQPSPGTPLAQQAAMCMTALGSSYRCTCNYATWRASLPCHIPSSQQEDPPLQTTLQTTLQLMLHGWKRASIS